jgi:hypothetical protein
MRTIFHAAILAAVSAASGCGIEDINEPGPPAPPAAPVTVILAWRDYNPLKLNMDDALYTLDGRPVGRGRYGARNVIDYMATLPRGSTVCVTYQSDSDPRGGGQAYTLPLNELTQEFLATAESHGVTLVWRQGVVGWGGMPQ